MYKTQFTVRGSFAFPMDMLRFDTCFPTTQNDVAAMMSNSDERDVNLTMYHAYKDAIVTIDRWSSFLWEVAEVQKAVKV